VNEVSTSAAASAGSGSDTDADAAQTHGNVHVDTLDALADALGVADEMELSERLGLLTDVQEALAGALEGLDGL